MARRIRIDPEPDVVYVGLVTALFDVETLTWTAAIVYTALGTYLAWVLADPFTATLTAIGVVLTVPRLLLLRAFNRTRRAGGDTCLDATTAAGWELRYSMGLILFATCVSALSLRMFAIGEPALMTLTLALIFGFCSGVVARVSVRPLVCTLVVAVAAGPSILSAALDTRPYSTALAVGLSAFLAATFYTTRHGYDVARRHLTIAHEMTLVAGNDPLTGLLNRLGLHRAFAAIAPAGAAPMLAVHYCDLDAFKPVNDRYGHPTGDAVLHQVALRIRDGLRATDLAARLGGDEFVVVQCPVGDAQEVDAFAAGLAARFDDPHMLGGEPVRVGVSIGSTLATAARPDLDRLLAEADRALYVAKQGLRDRGG